MPKLVVGLTHGRRTRIAPYVAALESAGLEVIGISPDTPRVAAEGLRGLALAGGTDINPALYGQTRHPDTESVLDLDRDRLELELLEQALRLDLPILAICRGMQMLNVRHGGSLIQHVDKHRFAGNTPEELALPRHDVHLLEHSRLARLLGAAKLHVNSRHHQAVDRPGPSLHIVGWSDDGVAEAAERTDRGFVVGVQWHPENCFASNPHDRKLFELFAHAASGQSLP